MQAFGCPHRVLRGKAGRTQTAACELPCPASPGTAVRSPATCTTASPLRRGPNLALAAARSFKATKNRHRQTKQYSFPIRLSTNPVNKFSAQKVAAWQSGAISRDTMFELFRSGEILPDGRTNQDEAALIGTGGNGREQRTANGH